MQDLRDATHVFSFWTGMSDESKTALGKLFLQSNTARVVAIVQHAINNGAQKGSVEEQFMLELGFGRVLLLGKTHLVMEGESRTFNPINDECMLNLYLYMYTCL
jgi:hypothetical protein